MLNTPSSLDAVVRFWCDPCPTYFLTYLSIAPLSNILSLTIETISFYSVKLVIKICVKTLWHCKIAKFLLISWCENSVKLLWKLCVSTKFLHQEIRWNFGISWSVRFVRFPDFFHFLQSSLMSLFDSIIGSVIK